MRGFKTARPDSLLRFKRYSVFLFFDELVVQGCKKAMRYPEGITM
jgi:hypothetical protein